MNAFTTANRTQESWLETVRESWSETVTMRRTPMLFDQSTTCAVARGLDGNERFALDFEEMRLHSLWLGRTGTGKSKGAQLYMRRLIDAYIPFVLIDAEGDLAEDVFGDVIAQARDTGSDAILKRTHYLRPDWDRVFGVDPFDASAVPNDPVAYQAWLFTQAKRMAGAIIRSQNETSTEGMPRLERVLADLLIAIGTAVGANGARLPLGNIFILLNFDHKKFDLVFNAVAPHLPAEIRQDFEQLLQLRNRPSELLKQTESTINRLRSFLSPIVKAIFSEIGRKAINLQEMIEGRGIIIFNLKDSEYLAAEQADALGRMIIYHVLTAMRSVGRTARVQCALIVDECQRFLTKDILVSLAQGRKWGLATALLTQTLYALELVEAGFGQTVLAAVGTVICFQQRLPHDLEILADYLFRPNLCYRELFTVQDRHRGYEWVDVQEKSENWTKTETWQTGESQAWSEGDSSSWSASESDQRSQAVARQENWSDGESEVENESSTHGASSGFSSGHGTNVGATPIMQDGPFPMMLPTHSESTSTGYFDQESDSKTEGSARGKNHSSGGGIASVSGQISGRSAGFGGSSSRAESGSVISAAGGGSSSGISVAYRRMPLAVIEPEWSPTGRLRWSCDDQLDRFKTIIATLPMACAAVRRDGRLTELVQFDFVDDPFPNPAFKQAILREFEQKLHAIHDYFIKPRIDPAADDQRIDDFLAAVAGTGTNSSVSANVVPQSMAVQPAPKHPF